MADTPGYVSNSVLAQRISELVDRWNTRENQMIALLTQPEGDVTVTDGLGMDHVLPSMLQLSSDVTTLVDELTGSVSQASDFANNARMYAESAQASSSDASDSADVATEQVALAQEQVSQATAQAQEAAGSATAAAESNQSAGLHENAASASAADADTDAFQASNSKSQAVASATAAAQSEADAAQHSSEAEGWSYTASRWASAPVNTEVEPGAYSAKHWAEQAKATLTGTLVYRGTWDASTGVFPADPNTGAFYKVGASGTVGDTQFSVGDQIVYSGTDWDHIDNSELVTSVAGQVGAVVLSSSDVGGLGALATKDKASFTSDLSDVPSTFPPSSHTHTKGDVGLSNVDNTSDANKPVSTAQQSALNAKAPTNAPTFTGRVTVSNNAFHAAGWGGTSGNGVIYFGSGDDSHIFKEGNAFKLTVGGQFVAQITAGGTVWSSDNFNPASKSDTTHNHGRTYVGNTTAASNSLSLGWVGSKVQVTVDASTWNVWTTKDFDPATKVDAASPRMSSQAVVAYNDGTAALSVTTTGGLQAVNNGGGAALISFHRPGIFACMFGLDTDNKLKVGGWSMGTHAYMVHHDGVSKKVFTQSGDPGTAASEGDLWVW